MLLYGRTQAVLNQQNNQFHETVQWAGTREQNICNLYRILDVRFFIQNMLEPVSLVRVTVRMQDWLCAAVCPEDS